METLKEDLDAAIEPVREYIRTWRVETNQESREVTILVEGIDGKAGRKIVDIRSLAVIRADPEANRAFLEQLSRFLLYFSDRPGRRKRGKGRSNI
ncbi:MAG: hypothetical protein AB7M93_21180 [Candidatus Obscuribacterales bacterium]